MTMRCLSIISLAALVLLACGCLQAGTGTPTPVPPTQGTAGTLTAITTTPSSAAGEVASLSDEERHWLAHMREEEKLARDVYAVLFERWNEPIFGTIAPSEQQHMDAIGHLLDVYGLPDPVVAHGPGEFEDRELQVFYNGLVRNGSFSRVAALKAGRLVEETDIADLDRAIASSRHGDVTNVYRNLRQGSLNHLAAFNNRLGRV